MNSGIRCNCWAARIRDLHPPSTRGAACSRPVRYGAHFFSSPVFADAAQTPSRGLFRLREGLMRWSSGRIAGDLFGEHDGRLGPGIVAASDHRRQRCAGADRFSSTFCPAGRRRFQPASSLPTITGLVDIDGTTQPGWSSAQIIQLSGNLAGGAASGFTINSPGSTIHGFVINRFGANGV